MSKKKTEIKAERAERLKMLIDREEMSQTAFSEKIGYSQQHVSGIVRQKTALTEETAADIISVFPEYRIEWLMGLDDFMTHEDFKRAYIKNNDIRNNALLTVLDAALHEACLREDLPVPTLENIPELILLESQLRDYAVSLMAGYLHRKDSHFWSNLDSLLNTAEEKLKK